ncbi:hypothetical protein TRFO_01460 [Tritrichomonas foetus]|uniref:VPS9 domain-containing protein n=1 Tax=Tritrichomonas foetus TaxID=1144522 RepID=A0A1J4K227_9EUKA|nr:hypothetical protein TRFO_01460 [Tritrichomonas foetus]|eukprot:OHT03790.1 hypothetical protein TRFO_01460 [Tritrichomonas foetus]
MANSNDDFSEIVTSVININKKSLIYVTYTKVQNTAVSSIDLLPENEKICVNLQIMREKYLIKDKSIFPIRDDMPKSLPVITKYKFMKKKLLHYQKSYRNMLIRFNRMIAKKLSKFQCLLAVANSKGYKIEIDLPKFLRDKKFKLSSSVKFKKLVWRISSIDNFISILINDDISLSDSNINKELRNSVDTLNSITLYSDYHRFDEIIHFILKENHLYSMISDIYQNNSHAFDSTTQTSLEQLGNELKPLFKPNITKFEQDTIHNSLIRLYFGYSYVQYPQLLTEIDFESSKLFFQNCQVISFETPMSMNISKALIRQDEYEESFNKIISIYDELKEAVAKLTSLQFLTSPLDIIANIQKAMEYIEIFVLVHVTNENFKLNKITNRAGLMSFDDIFALFCPTLAYDPPSNCLSIYNFCKNADISLRPQFQFAREIFLSAIDYISNYHKNIII